MATTSNKLADVPQPVSGSDVLSANLLCVQNGRVTQVPGYLKKISDTRKSVDDLKAAVFDMIYPVGSYYWSSNATNPGSIFGGTWEQIKDRFVLAAGGTYAVDATGGEASHTLSVNEMPSHSHGASSGSAGNHGHSASTNWTGDHAHRFAGGGGFVGGGTYGSAGAGIRVDSSGYIINDNTTSAGGHSHSVTVNANGAHSHTISVSATGGSAAHNNMPPYIVAYCWHRTA